MGGALAGVDGGEAVGFGAAELAVGALGLEFLLAQREDPGWQILKGNVRKGRTMKYFSRPKPKTRFGRCLRYAEGFLTVLVLLYASLHFFPQVVFHYSATVRGVTVYSRRPLPPEATACALRIASLVEHSELAVPGRRERVFVCNSPFAFRLFNPKHPTSFAYSVPVTENIFVAEADFSRDLVNRAGSDFRTRCFSAVAAHEITHGLIRHRLGPLRGRRLSEWVAEGYCDYIAQEGSFPEGEGFRLMITGQRHPSTSFSYFTYRQMVRHLIESQHLSFEQIVSRASDFDAVHSETVQAIKATLEISDFSKMPKLRGARK